MHKYIRLLVVVFIFIIYVDCGRRNRKFYVNRNVAKTPIKKEAVLRKQLGFCETTMFNPCNPGICVNGLNDYDMYTCLCPGGEIGGLSCEGYYKRKLATLKLLHELPRQNLSTKTRSLPPETIQFEMEIEGVKKQLDLKPKFILTKDFKILAADVEGPLLELNLPETILHLIPGHVYTTPDNKSSLYISIDNVMKVEGMLDDNNKVTYDANAARGRSADVLGGSSSHLVERIQLPLKQKDNTLLENANQESFMSETPVELNPAKRKKRSTDYDEMMARQAAEDAGGDDPMPYADSDPAGSATEQSGGGPNDTLASTAGNSSDGVPKQIALEIWVLYDDANTQTFDENVEKIIIYLSTFWNKVSTLYEQETTDPKIRLALGGIILASKDLTDSLLKPSVEDGVGMEATMVRLKKWVEEEASDATMPQNFDCMVLQTKFGAEVDTDEEGCASSDGFLLYADKLGDELKQLKFSPCSLRKMQEYVRQPDQKCLWDDPSIFFPEDLLPGSTISLSEQCIQGTDKEEAQFQGQVNDEICAKFTCYNGTGDQDLEGGALDGSPCGFSKVCIYNKCVHFAYPTVYDLCSQNGDNLTPDSTIDSCEELRCLDQDGQLSGDILRPYEGTPCGNGQEVCVNGTCTALNAESPMPESLTKAKRMSSIAKAYPAEDSSTSGEMGLPSPDIDGTFNSYTDGKSAHALPKRMNVEENGASDETSPLAGSANHYPDDKSAHGMPRRMNVGEENGASDETSPLAGSANHYPNDKSAHGMPRRMKVGEENGASDETSPLAGSANHYPDDKSAHGMPRRMNVAEENGASDETSSLAGSANHYPDDKSAHGMPRTVNLGDDKGSSVDLAGLADKDGTVHSYPDGESADGMFDTVNPGGSNNSSVEVFSIANDDGDFSNRTDDNYSGVDPDQNGASR